MLGLGEPMIDIGLGAGVLEGMTSEGFLARYEFLDLRRGRIASVVVAQP
jgi:hypothetical protein